AFCAVFSVPSLRSTTPVIFSSFFWRWASASWRTTKKESPAETAPKRTRLISIGFAHHFQQFFAKAELARLVVLLGSQAAGFLGADDAAVFVFALAFKEEQILHGDDLAFHAGDFRDMRDFARTVAQALHLYDNVDRG